MMPSSETCGGFLDIPPFVYSTPYHIFNIDDDVSGGHVGELKVAFPPGDHFAICPPFCTFEEDPIQALQYQLASPPPFDFEGGKEPPLQDGPPFLPYGSQAASAHNKRMIFPYSYKKRAGKKETGASATAGSQSVRDEPLLLYRFFEFYCTNCEQCWLNPRMNSKNGCYCRICHQFILPRGIRHSFTPYLGKETCYGKYSCHLCNRGWSSYKSLSNRPDQCFECGTLVYPYYQIAHSVLFQKIHKNDDELKGKSAFLKSFFLTKSSGQADDLGGSGNATRKQQKDRRRQSQHQPRKITSISGLLPLTGKPTMTSKKRLHCLNNVPFVRHSAHQVRRQFHLKNCFSEPTISNTT